MKRIRALSLFLIILIPFLSFNLSIINPVLADPTIFEDGFESGDFSAWTGTGGSPAIVTSPVHHGGYAGQFDSNGDYCYKSVGDYTTLFIRIYLYINAASGTDYTCFIEFKDSGGIRKLYVGIRGGLYNLYIRYENGYDVYYDVISSTVLELNTWYCLEAKSIISSTVGEAHVYLNGNEISDLAKTGLNNAFYSTIMTAVVGTPSNYLATTVTIDCVVVADAYIGVEPENQAPVNDQFSITNMDDTDNIYAQYKNYIVDSDHHDNDGYANINYVLINLTQNSLIRGSFKYNEADNVFSLIAGSSSFELITGSCSYSKSGNNLNLTWVFRVKWGSLQENDLELKAYIIDDVGASDTDTKNDYCDLINDLVVSNYQINDNRGDVGASLTISGLVTYSGSSLYPPDSDFNNVQIWDQDNNVEGIDNTIINGAFSVSFSASSTVKNETYNPYIDMADSDYVDSEEGIYVWYVSDKVKITNVYSSDSRLNKGATVIIYVHAELEFDGHCVGGGVGDTMSINGLNMIWDSGNSRWYVEDTENTVTKNIYDTCLSYEATYGVSVVNQNGKFTEVIWDQIRYRFYALPINPHKSTGTFIRLVSFYYEYDGENVTYSSFQVQRNGTNYLNPQKDIYFGDYNETAGIVYIYTISSVSGDQYGISIFVENAQCRVEWISCPPVPVDPVARFNSTLIVYVNNSTFLDGSMSLDPDGGSLVNYAWDFGDGNETSGNYPTIYHTWKSLGDYTIKLTVTDDESETNTFLFNIEVISSEGAGPSFFPTNIFVVCLLGIFTILSLKDELKIFEIVAGIFWIYAAITIFYQINIGFGILCLIPGLFFLIKGVIDLLPEIELEI